MSRDVARAQILRHFPYRARFRDVRPGDNAGALVAETPGWRAEEQRDELSALMCEIPSPRPV